MARIIAYSFPDGESNDVVDIDTELILLARIRYFSSRDYFSSVTRTRRIPKL